MEELLNVFLDFAAQSGGIISDVQQLSVSLTDLAASADAVHGTFQKTWATIETGARLQGLSSVTGESVSKLYEFEQGLEAVDRKAKYLPAIFADMQRALSHTSGTSRAEEAFAELHLNPDQLRKEDTADAVVQFASALGKLDSNQATRVGNKIFGRFQTESVLAIARNLELFQQVMQKSSQTGASLEKYSKTFEEVKASRIGINNDILGNRAEFAGKIAPEILSIFAGIGDHIKNLGPLFASTLSGNLNAMPSNFATVADSSFGQNHYRPEFTSLEKMGFIMSGSKVHNPYDQRKIDLLQQIAQNTSRHGPAPGPSGISWIRDPILPPAEVSNIV